MANLGDYNGSFEFMDWEDAIASVQALMAGLGIGWDHAGLQQWMQARGWNNRYDLDLAGYSAIAARLRKRWDEISPDAIAANIVAHEFRRLDRLVEAREIGADQLSREVQRLAVCYPQQTKAALRKRTGGSNAA